MRKKHLKVTGRLKSYTTSFTMLGIFLILINLGIYTYSRQAGMLLSVGLGIYFLVLIALNLYNKPVILNELISFATQYGQIQKQLLKNMEMPYCILDDSGRVIWSNTAFGDLIHQPKGYSKPLSSIFPSFTKDKLLHDEMVGEFSFSFEGGEYRAKMHKVFLSDMMDSSDILGETSSESFLIAMYIFDETALSLALQENDNQSLAVGLIYLDNYEEALDSVEDVRRSLLIALMDRKVNKYMSALDGITKKLEKDKYMVILRKESVRTLASQRFDILEDAKTVNIGNEMSMTLSIGIGLDGLSYAQNYEFARAAIDIALGRGGDQAVVKTKDSVSYYGGKSQQIEKNTRVKARVKAHALSEIISGKDRVIVMGHRLADVDSFGAAVGVYRIATALDKKANIVINTVSTSVQPLVDRFKNNPDYPEDMLLDSTQAVDAANSSNAVLVVVDVNKPSITECPELLHLCKSIVVLDHHRAGSEVIENSTLSYVEPYASSAAEMVTEIMQYVADGVRPKNDEADCLYSGIMIDTNNFMTKTGVRTFEAAAYLRRNGADVTRVRKIFREDAAEYKAKADAVSQAEIYRKNYAISIFTGDGIQSPTIVGAQAANELLNIKGIKASFVVTPFQMLQYVSARSIDEVNVQVVMERLGGGGHMNIAGTQMEGISCDEAVRAIKNIIDQLIEEGELD